MFKKISFSGKIIGLVVMAVVLVSGATFLSTYYLMTGGFNDQTQKEITKLSEAVQNHLDGKVARLTTAARQVASRPDVAQAVEKKDTAYLQQVGREMVKKGDAGLVTIAEAGGSVVARGHSDKAGDSVLNQTNVQKALAGEVAAGLEEGTEVKFSIRVGHPVKSGDRVVGSVTVGENLTGGHGFVDEVKKVFGVECTFFQNDTRVSTTLVKDGQRILGTRMDNPKVIEAVLQKGERFTNVNKIMGKDYNTAYWPVRNAEGKIAGMLFIGVDRSGVVEATRNVVLSLLFCMLAVGGIMTVVGFAVVRSITRPVNAIVGDMAKSAQQVTLASTQVSSVSISLAEGASEQASSIEETSSSLEEMSSMVKQNAQNAKVADDLMMDTKKLVDQANSSMVQLTSSMADISRASEETSKIIKTIDEIAFQTNLLALNAAVEAARAGEAGAGFAVVANEVRNLALRAAEAAKSTAGLIEGTVRRVQEGSEYVGATNKAFAEVAVSAAKVKDLIGDISAASNEQAQGIEQVSRAVVEVDRVIQQTAASAEEAASASEQMKAQASTLQELVRNVSSIMGKTSGEEGVSPLAGLAAKLRRKPGATAQAAAGTPAAAAPAKPESPPAAAKPSAKDRARKPKPSEIIPLEDADFKDF